ncbi:DUF1761 domain-containing protein [Paenibacillus sp. R14(2021)]|uniref:DUF1761 domain-containing protein n=1 Tax=Paenibacillus sp. R14(2021) TaxID=2859228 RepID=UPI001C612581|nr:DUF1761 domain-containing protein [Paenibacillus sp. R14(2021)]
MLDFGAIHYWGILVATVVTMVLGFLWYSPVLFGKAWAKQVGLNMADMSGGAMTYVLTAATALIGVFLLGLLMTVDGGQSVSSGLLLGLIIGLAIAVKIGMNYLFEGRKLSLYFITIGYHLTSYLLSGLIIGLM